MPDLRSDDELMLACRDGDTHALEEIFARYQKRLFNFGLKLLGHLADAEDVVSETFRILSVKKDTYQPQGTFTAWIFTITRNLCMDKLRARRRLMGFWRLGGEDSEGPEVEFASAEAGPDEDAETQDMKHHVRAALARLPVRYREALILREYQGLKYEEIARVLGCTVGNVKVLILRGREKLRVELLPLLKEAT